MRHHLITLACFGAATLLWYFGLRDDAALLMAGAGLVELVGWTRLFRRRRNA